MRFAVQILHKDREILNYGNVGSEGCVKSLDLYFSVL